MEMEKNIYRYINRIILAQKTMSKIKDDYTSTYTSVYV